MSQYKVETPNQLTLLRSLSMTGAKVSWHWRGASLVLSLPGIPNQTTSHISKQTFKACLKRGWLIGNDEKGYTISASGMFALGNSGG